MIMHVCKRYIAIRGDGDREGEGAGKLLMTLSNPTMKEKSDNEKTKCMLNRFSLRCEISHNQAANIECTYVYVISAYI